MNRRRNDKSKRFNASEVVARRNVYLVIDGYNLMHVTRFKPLNNEMGELKRCREGLLSLLAERLLDHQYREITVVFDSDQAPKHLPDQLRWRHIDVIFARNENTADDYIAKLVQGHAHPRQLIVISSDHRVQNAASRRKATVLDSDDWFDALLDYKPTAELYEPTDDPPNLDGEELSEFIAEMKKPKEIEPEIDDKAIGTEPDDEFENPFPEGYFDDLNEQE